MIDAVEAPTLVYRKGPIPTDDLLLELADDPRVVGVKYAVNEMHGFRTTMLADAGRIEWLCGSAERFAPFYMLLGSPGYTPGAGTLAPHVTLAVGAALAAGDALGWTSSGRHHGCGGGTGHGCACKGTCGRPYSGWELGGGWQLCFA